MYPEESSSVDTDYMQGESSLPKKQAHAELLYICYSVKNDPALGLLLVIMYFCREEKVRVMPAHSITGYY